MTAFLETFRPQLLANAAVEEAGPQRHLDATIFESDAAGAVVQFTASVGEAPWVGLTKLSDLQRFLADIEDGLMASLPLGHETATVEGGSDVIEVPIGPQWRHHRGDPLRQSMSDSHTDMSRCTRRVDTLS